MPGPGSGRYTNYIPVDTSLAPSKTRYGKRYNLFNSKSPKGDFLGTSNANDLVNASAAALESLTDRDLQMFPTEVKKDFSTAPNLSDAQKDRPGDPANPYVPDLSSPGAGKTEGSDKTGFGSIPAVDIKPTFAAPASTVLGSAANAGAQSPNVTSTLIGSTVISPDPAKGLVMGKSRGTAGG